MLRLAFDVIDGTAMTVQQDLHDLEHHLLAVQFRKSQRQIPLTSHFQPYQAPQVERAGLHGDG